MARSVTLRSPAAMAAERYSGRGRVAEPEGRKQTDSGGGATNAIGVMAAFRVGAVDARGHSGDDQYCCRGDAPKSLLSHHQSFRCGIEGGGPGRSGDGVLAR